MRKKKQKQHQGHHRPAAADAPRPVPGGSLWEMAAHLLDQVGGENPADALQRRARREPKDPVVQLALAEALLHAGRAQEAVAPARRAAELAPGNVDVLRVLASVYTGAEMLGHAGRVYRELQGKATGDLRRLVDQALQGTEAIFADVAARLAIDRTAAEEAYCWMQEGWLALSLGDAQKGLAASERSLTFAPRFAPALNNRAEALYRLGRLSEAAAVLRRVVDEVEPRNVHALGSLVRYLLFLGDREGAAAIGARLAAVPLAAPDDRLKAGAAFAWLGDDENTYRVLHGHEELGHWALRMLATAAANLRKGTEARRMWDALEQQGIARVFVEQARRVVVGPAEMRLAYNTVTEVIGEDVLRRLSTLCEQADKGSVKARRDMRELLAAHPEVRFAAEVALKTPATEPIGIMLLESLGTPEAVQALRAFTTGKSGTLDGRRFAGETLVNMGALAPDETVPFWTAGQMQPASFRKIEIHGEPTPVPPGAVAETERYSELLYARRAGEAATLLESLTRRFPDVPRFWNDLGAAYDMLGRRDEAVRAYRRAIELDPQYVFPRVAMADLAINDEDTEGAREWIQPVMNLARYHRTAFAALLRLQARLALGEDDPETARRHLEMMRELAPESPNVAVLEQQIERYEAQSSVSLNMRSFFARYEKSALQRRQRRRAGVSTRDPSLAQALAPMTKGQISDLVHNSFLYGVSALKKDAMRDALVSHLRQPWTIGYLAGRLSDEDRTALAWVLEQGGSAPQEEFGRRYGVDPDALVRLRHQQTVLDRLMSVAALVESEWDGVPLVAVPVDLRELWRRALAGDDLGREPEALGLEP